MRHPSGPRGPAVAGPAGGRPVLGALLLAVLVLAFPPVPALALIADGDQAVPFTGPDLEGKPFDLKDHLGKQVVVLKFGSIYCSTCVQSIAAFSDLQKKHSTDVLKVLEVNLDIYGVVRVKRFYQGYQEIVRYPVMVDKELKVSLSYGVTSLPSVVVIGKDGKVARVVRGYEESQMDSLMTFIDNLILARTTIVELAGSEGAGDEGGLRILFPTNFTKTQQETLYLVGAVPEPGGTVVLNLNGGSRQEIVPKRKLFYLRTPLSLGSNYVEVSQATGGRTVSKAVVLFREPKIGKGFQNEFPTYHYHLKENERRCTQCHELSPPQSTEQNFQTITKMCEECHQELSGTSYVHGPITVGGCAPCHDFASLPARYELINSGADLCYSCHQEKRDEFARPYVHGPLAAGICSVCHSPHGSNERFQLRLPEGQLCFLCHQQMKAMSMLESLHKPFDEGHCAACHNPHSSNNPRYFLTFFGDELCYSCHSEDAMESHKHPVGVVPIFSFPGIKLNELGELTCLSCHNPHASAAEKLLPGQGCPSCHTY